MSGKKTPIDFEQALDELQQLVEKMEQGELSLDASLQHFERGIGLIRDCEKALTQAEQKVKLLIENHARTELADFMTDDEQS